MTEERTIKELLQLMLEHQELFNDGLCNWKSSLMHKSLISLEEYYVLKYYMRENKPNMFSSWHVFKHRIRFTDVYYWTPNKIEPRVKWLKQHISKL